MLPNSSTPDRLANSKGCSGTEKESDNGGELRVSYKGPKDDVGSRLHGDKEIIDVWEGEMIASGLETVDESCSNHLMEGVQSVAPGTEAQIRACCDSTPCQTPNEKVHAGKREKVHSIGRSKILPMMNTAGLSRSPMTTVTNNMDTVTGMETQPRLGRLARTPSKQRCNATSETSLFHDPDVTPTKLGFGTPGGLRESLALVGGGMKGKTSNIDVQRRSSSIGLTRWVILYLILCP